MTSIYDRVKNRITKRLKQLGNYLKIIELDLSQIKIKRISTQIKNEIQKCKNLESLLMCECELETLDNLPQIEHLNTLDLTTNRLKSSHIIYLKQYKQLSSLYLIQNQIDSVSPFKHLSSLSQLNSIDLTDNPVTQVPQYRQQMFKTIEIQVLDEKDQDGNTVYDDQEEFDQFDVDKGFQDMKRKTKAKNHKEDEQEEDQSDHDDSNQDSQDQDQQDEDVQYDANGNAHYKDSDSEEQSESRSKKSKKSTKSSRSKQSAKITLQHNKKSYTSKDSNKQPLQSTKKPVKRIKA